MADAKTKGVKTRVVWALFPTKEMEERFYKAKSKYQQANPGPLSDRDFHRYLLDEGIKNFGF